MHIGSLCSKHFSNSLTDATAAACNCSNFFIKIKHWPKIIINMNGHSKNYPIRRPDHLSGLSKRLHTKVYTVFFAAAYSLLQVCSLLFLHCISCKQQPSSSTNLHLLLL